MASIDGHIGPKPLLLYTMYVDSGSEISMRWLKCGLHKGSSHCLDRPIHVASCMHRHVTVCSHVSHGAMNEGGHVNNGVCKFDKDHELGWWAREGERERRKEGDAERERERERSRERRENGQRTRKQSSKK